MRERLFDVVKWGLVTIIAGMVFYVFCPKYDFKLGEIGILKYNKMTGQSFYYKEKKWIEMK